MVSSHISDSLDSISKVVYDIVCDEDMRNEILEAKSIEEWEDKVITLENEYLEMLPEEYGSKVIECIVREQARMTDDPGKYINIWKEYKKGGIY